MNSVFTTASILLPFCFLAGSTHAQGIYRNGIGARSMSMGGADVAFAEGPLGAMAANPAGLAGLEGFAADLGLLGGLVDGEFTNASNPSGSSLREKFRVGGEAAVAMPLGSTPITLGLSVIPEASLQADWQYFDTDPDGAGGTFVSYGNRQHKSEILVLRSALGVSWKISDKFMIGASVGLIYNDNTLLAPYIFQTQPTLGGLKTLLDLNTDGFGVDGTVGILWKPTEKIQIGLSYKAPSTVNSKGDANGDATAQAAELLNVALPPGAGAFHYDAEVVNHFPQMASAGISWQACEKWRLTAQVDWIGWEDAFDDLQVKLRNGSNGTLNGLIGSPNMKDEVPLHWKNQMILRGGFEYAVAEDWQLRAGYSYGRSPVPDSHLLPLVAAIMEHTIGAGVGWSHCHYRIAAAYQYSIPAEQSVGASLLRSGEYSNSKVEVSAHALALTAGVRF